MKRERDLQPDTRSWGDPAESAEEDIAIIREFSERNRAPEMEDDPQSRHMGRKRNRVRIEVSDEVVENIRELVENPPPPSDELRRLLRSGDDDGCPCRCRCDERR